MTKYTETETILADTNLSKNETRVYITRLEKSRKVYVDWSKEEKTEIHWSKVQIKETDMRIKTASFSSPQYLDLTTGVFCVLIVSTHYENFSGIVLDVEYDRKTGIYTYKCQDWSRKHQSKTNFNAVNDTLYSILQFMISNGQVGFPPIQRNLKAWASNLSGLRPAYEYNEADWGGILKGNPMTSTYNLLIRDKSFIEIIRDLVFGSSRYIDVYFNDNGIIQIEPFQKDDFEKTGVHIDNREVSDIKVSFDTTNIISNVMIRNSNDANELGKQYGNNLLMDFFGIMTASKSNITDTNTSNTGGSSSSTGTKENPYGNKAKKIWINADNGSGSFKNSVANLLKQKGWTVKDGGTCSNCHYSGYFDVTSDYQVYATVYNGFCAGTIREAYSDKIQSVLNKKGVVLVVMWDTSSWTNPNGMKPYRYGDFTGYNAGRAWDDNFSSSDPSISNVASWLKSKDAKYCASPTAEGVVNQFLAGGYFASVGK